MPSSPLPQRIQWDADNGQFFVPETEDMLALSPCPSPLLGDDALQRQRMDFKDAFANTGCSPQDISLACNLVHSYLSLDIYEPGLLVRVWEYLNNVLDYTGLREKYGDLVAFTAQAGYSEYQQQTDKETGNLGANLIRYSLKNFSEVDLATILRFPFTRTADREHAEVLCRIWLQTHYKERSRNNMHTRQILYDLYATFENLFRLTNLPTLKDIPQWEQTGFADKWASLNYKPGRAHRSPTMSRSSLRLSISSASGLSALTSPTTGVAPSPGGLASPSTPRGGHHSRSRSNSSFLELPRSPATPSGSYGNLFDAYEAGRRPSTPHNEAGRSNWFMRNVDPEITAEHGDRFPVWKTLYAHLIAGARVEYMIASKKLGMMDVLVALSNTSWIGTTLFTNETQYGLVDLGYYIFLRDRAINNVERAGDRAALESFEWSGDRIQGLQLMVTRIEQYLSPVPAKKAQSPALGFLEHIARSLQYCGHDYQIPPVVRADGITVDAQQIRREINSLTWQEEEDDEE